MDSNDRRTRQNNAPGYAGQQALLQSSSQYPASSGADRFRQSQLAVQSPTSAPSAGRTGSIQGYTYPYGDGSAQFAASSPMQAGSLQYPAAAAAAAAEYAAQDSTQRSQQQTTNQQTTAQYQQQYSSNMMYGVQSQQQAAVAAAAAVAAPPQASYDSVQPYQPRQSAAIEVLSNQFGVTPTYYVPGEGGPTSAPNSGMTAQNVHPQYNQLSYTTQSPVVRDPLAPTYPSGMTDPEQASGSQAAYGQTNTYAAQNAAELDNAYGSYQTELRRTFECVRDGRLADAGTSLVHISDWLLGNAEALGLVRDDEAMYSERLKLWDEFNTCWLSVLQKQRELTRDMIDSGQRPHPPQTLLESDYLETMGKELVRLCDIMEKHGLVDYQMGVWEEEIMGLLSQCLDLLQEHEGNASGNAVNAQSSSTRRR